MTFPPLQGLMVNVITTTMGAKRNVSLAADTECSLLSMTDSLYCEKPENLFLSK